MNSLKKQRWQPTVDQKLAQLLTQCEQSPLLIERLWQPLCIAALNTPINEACAQIFAAVLRDSLGSGRHSTQLLIPLKDMTQLWAPQALQHHRYHTATPIQKLQDSTQPLL